jgi:flagellar hook-associated protein 1 FlgK
MSMTIGTALSIASGGLAVVGGDLALVSQNIANANTPDYAVETATRISQTAGGMALGVRSGPATRQLDLVLQAETLAQSGTVADLTTRQGTLAAIDAAQGTPGQGNDLASLLGNLQDAFSSLQGQPDNATQQVAVVSAAGDLARGLNGLSDTYATERQAAQDDIAASIGTLNAALGTIGRLTDQIIALRAADTSTADLENQRDAALRTVSQLVGVKALNQANGDLVLTTAGGLALPTRGPAALATAGATLGAGAWYPAGGIPPITLNGVDVTAQFTGGRIGADVALRDTTLPTYQGELDEFARTIAVRFDAQGLRLFTDPAGTVPAAGGVPAQSG